MKRFVVVAVLTLLCSLLLPGAVGARFGDSTRGHGEDVNLGRFSFTVEGFGTSTGAIGTWKHTTSRDVSGVAFSFEGDVRCLVVTGNTAVFGGVVTRATFRNNVGNNFSVTVQDNDGVGADRYAFTVSTLPLPFFDPCAPIANSPITKGDIEVVASTFPP